MKTTTADKLKAEFLKQLAKVKTRAQQDKVVESYRPKLAKYNFGIRYTRTSLSIIDLEAQKAEKEAKKKFIDELAKQLGKSKNRMVYGPRARSLYK